ncbi:MAG: serine/threonine protein kinase [Deltaproteobacteria bacterium]|nr:serine/threonine protein kinase [Deltaproteobacteria bacterium]
MTPEDGTCPDDAALARLIDGDLAPAARAALLAHLDDCAACLAVVAGAAGDEPEALGPGDRLGRYTIVGLLGAGAMGAVYDADDRELERRVALKLVRRDRAHDDAAVAERLRAEARALARVSSPYVVAVHDVGVEAGRLVIAMERVVGSTLGAWLVERPRSRAAIVDRFVEAARGLADAHDAGVVHRDFKPDNALVGADGRVRVSDFGLARCDLGLDDEPGEVSGTRTIVTRTIAGTPAYMAPEQRAGGAVGAAADQFAFCIALAEALTGARPDATAPRVVGAVPERLRRALVRGLAADPAARWPSMRALIAALAGWSSAGQRRRRRMIAAVAAVMIGAVAVVAVVQAAPRAPTCDGGADEIAATWAGDDRLLAALRALDARRGPAVATEVARALDGFASSWARERDLACRLGPRDEVVARQMRDACLDRAQLAAAALIASLRAATPADLDAAGGAAQGLPPPALCARATVDPAAFQPAAALALERRIATARAEVDLGHIAGARATALGLVADADRAGLAGPRLHARLVLASALAFEDQPQAIAIGREAAALAIAAGDELGQADALLGLTDAYARAVRHAEAELSLSLAQAILDHLGGDPRRAASGALSLCLYGWRRGPDFTAARAACAAAKARIAADGAAADDRRFAWVDTELANIALVAGQVDDAIAIYRRLIAAHRDRGEPEDHLANLAIALTVARRWAEAAALLDEIVAIAPDRVAAWDHLAMARRELGDRGGALAAHAQAATRSPLATDPIGTCDRWLDYRDALVGRRPDAALALAGAAMRCLHGSEPAQERLRTALGDRHTAARIAPTAP